LFQRNVLVGKLDKLVGKLNKNLQVLSHVKVVLLKYIEVRPK